MVPGHKRISVMAKAQAAYRRQGYSLVPREARHWEKHTCVGQPPLISITNTDFVEDLRLLTTFAFRSL